MANENQKHFENKMFQELQDIVKADKISPQDRPPPLPNRNVADYTEIQRPLLQLDIPMLGTNNIVDNSEKVKHELDDTWPCLPCMPSPPRSLSNTSSPTDDGIRSEKIIEMLQKLPRKGPMCVGYEETPDECPLPYIFCPIFSKLGLKVNLDERLEKFKTSGQFNTDHCQLFGTWEKIGGGVRKEQRMEPVIHRGLEHENIVKLYKSWSDYSVGNDDTDSLTLVQAVHLRTLEHLQQETDSKENETNGVVSRISYDDDDYDAEEDILLRCKNLDEQSSPQNPTGKKPCDHETQLQFLFEEGPETDSKENETNGVVSRISYDDDDYDAEEDTLLRCKNLDEQSSPQNPTGKKPCDHETQLQFLFEEGPETDSKENETNGVVSRISYDDDDYDAEEDTLLRCKNLDEQSSPQNPTGKKPCDHETQLQFLFEEGPETDSKENETNGVVSRISYDDDDYDAEEDTLLRCKNLDEPSSPQNPTGKKPCDHETQLQFLFEEGPERDSKENETNGVVSRISYDDDDYDAEEDTLLRCKNLDEQSSPQNPTGKKPCDHETQLQFLFEEGPETDSKENETNGVVSRISYDDDDYDAEEDTLLRCKNLDEQSSPQNPTGKKPCDHETQLQFLFEEGPETDSKENETNGVVSRISYDDDDYDAEEDTLLRCKNLDEQSSPQNPTGKKPCDHETQLQFLFEEGPERDSKENETNGVVSRISYDDDDYDAEEDTLLRCKNLDEQSSPQNPTGKKPCDHETQLQFLFEEGPVSRVVTSKSEFLDDIIPKFTDNPGFGRGGWSQGGRQEIKECQDTALQPKKTGNPRAGAPKPADIKAAISKAKAAESKHHIYMLMEYGGETLKEWLQRPRDETKKELNNLDIFSQIVNAVVYLHEKGITHGDLLTRNIYLNENLHVKLGDFGLAKQLEYDRRTTDDFKEDMQMLGAILFQLFVRDIADQSILMKAEQLQDGEVEDSIYLLVPQYVAKLIIMLVTEQPSASDVQRRIYDEQTRR